MCAVVPEIHIQLATYRPGTDAIPAKNGSPLYCEAGEKLACARRAKVNLQCLGVKTTKGSRSARLRLMTCARSSERIAPSRTKQAKNRQINQPSWAKPHGLHKEIICLRLHKNSTQRCSWIARLQGYAATTSTSCVPERLQWPIPKKKKVKLAMDGASLPRVKRARSGSRPEDLAPSAWHAFRGRNEHAHALIFEFCGIEDMVSLRLADKCTLSCVTSAERTASDLDHTRRIFRDKSVKDVEGWRRCFPFWNVVRLATTVEDRL
jgi:hypothetical protein